MGKLLAFPPPGRPVPQPTIPPDVAALVAIDADLATLDELAAMSAERLTDPSLSPGRRLWELECWLGHLRDRWKLEAKRELVLSGGLRLVTGGGQ